MRTMRFRAVLAEFAALACATAVFVASALESPAETASAAAPAAAVAR